jgi:AraC-like DNA-binding protein
MRLRTFDLASVKIATLAISESAVTTAPYPYYTVVTNLAGAAHIIVGGKSTLLRPQQVTVVSPGRPVHVDYVGSATRVRTVVIDRLILEEELSAMTGRTVVAPIEFAPGPSPRTADNPFHHALGTLDRELRDPAGLASYPATRSHLTRALLCGLLLGHPHTWWDELLYPTRAAGPKTIRRALEAIEKDPAAFATVTDLARVAGLSVRALEDGFRRYVESPPMRHVRRVRLSRAHEELGATEPDQTTATAIAQRWGFAHYALRRGVPAGVRNHPGRDAAELRGGVEARPEPLRPGYRSGPCVTRACADRA